MLRKGLLILCGSALLAACAGSSGTRPAKPAKPASSANANAAELQLKLGQGYMEQGDYEVALEKLTRAIELDPSSADAQTVIAVLYEQIGRRDRAETHYRRSLALKPDSGVMLNNFGAFLCRTERHEESLGYFQKALDDPFYKTPEAALANAGSCARKAGRLQLAEQHYRAALKHQPNDAGVLLEMADIMFQNGKLMSARAFMQRYIALDMASAEALALAVQIELGLGDKAEAARLRETLERDFPTSNALQALQDKDPS